jgi:hypothetical protein
MGTWSTAVFGSDIACDVRDSFVDYLRMGMSGRQATRKVLQDFDDEVQDVDQDGPVVWLALAATQWKYGRLEPRVKGRALKLIKNGADIPAFPQPQQNRRQNALEKLRLQLQSPPPPEKPVRVVKPAPRLKKIERLWTPGQVVAWRFENGRLALLLTEAVVNHSYIGQIPYFVRLKWEGVRLPPPDRIQKLRATDTVVGVHPNRKGTPIPWDRIQRLDLTRPLTGIVQADRAGVFCETGFNEGHWNELDEMLE